MRPPASPRAISDTSSPPTSPHLSRSPALKCIHRYETGLPNVLESFIITTDDTPPCTAGDPEMPIEQLISIPSFFQARNVPPKTTTLRADVVVPSTCACGALSGASLCLLFRDLETQLPENRDGPANPDHALAALHSVWLTRVAMGVPDDDRSMARRHRDELISFQPQSPRSSVRCSQT